MKSLQSLQFDDWKYKALFQVQQESKYYRTFTEEHVSLIKETGGQSVDHVSPSFGSAPNIIDSIMVYLKPKNQSIDTLKVLSCDGTVSKIGYIDGVICLLELRLNQLLFKHLMENIEGNTSGPPSYSGPIRKQLEVSR